MHTTLIARAHWTCHMICSRRISCKYDISSCALRAGAARCAALMHCMQLKPVMCHRRRREAAQAKAALNCSRSGRGAADDGDAAAPHLLGCAALAAHLALERNAGGRSSLPVAPMNSHTRWSVSGATPRAPPLASPAGSNGVKPLRRRKSEPNMQTAAIFKTPPGGLRPPNVRLSFGDSNVVLPSGSALSVASGGGTPRRSNGVRSPGSESRAAEVVHSPLSYFGTQPDVSSRFLQVPQGDGGVQALFEDAAGGPGGSLTAEELLKLAVDRLDLPRAVARLVVKRAQAKQKELAKVEQLHQQKENAPMQTPKRGSPSASPLLRETPGLVEREPGVPPPLEKPESPGAQGAADDRVRFPAFFAVYGRHRPEENDRIRLFRLVKRGTSPWVLKGDVKELVWAISETHCGLEFLRDSTEFLEAYVNTTTLRVLWALSGAGTERITLQHWRHSSITEVLFQLDDEADINLVSRAHSCMRRTRSVRV